MAATKIVKQNQRFQFISQLKKQKKRKSQLKKLVPAKKINF